MTTWIKTREQLPGHEDGNVWGCVIVLDIYGSVQNMNWRRVGKIDWRRWGWWMHIPQLPNDHPGHPDSPQPAPPMSEEELAKQRKIVREASEKLKQQFNMP